MKQSLTIQGLVVVLIGFALSYANVDVVDGDIERFIYVGIEIVGAAMTYIGRIRKGDVNFFGIRK